MPTGNKQKGELLKCQGRTNEGPHARSMVSRQVHRIKSPVAVDDDVSIARKRKGSSKAWEA